MNDTTATTQNNGSPEKPVIVLSGGVGGAKLVLGFSHSLPANQVKVVTNTGDDFEHLGLRICPDTDTVLYTLAGLSNTDLGWGRQGESWQFMETLTGLGGPDWFNLGDADLALHVLRTEALKSGKNLTEVIANLAEAMNIGVQVLPMSDQTIETRVNTPDGQLGFQEYFVRDRCAPAVTGFEFHGIDVACTNPVLMELLAAGPRAIIIAPSNPYVSVDPILQVPGLRDALKQTGAPIVGVSPIVGGKAIKGPAAKMMVELGVPSTAGAIAKHYAGFLDGLIIDEQDADQAETVSSHGMQVLVSQTVMDSLDDRIALARSSLVFAENIGHRSLQSNES